MAQKIGFIGLGRMGRPLCANILKAGFDLIVQDVQPEPVAELVKRGARAAKSAREVAEYADIAAIAIRHEPEVDPSRTVEAVLQGPDGLLAGAHPGLIVVIHSAVHPVAMMKIAEDAKSHGVEVLDAQMSGGASGAEAGSLCMMIGGDASTLDRCRPMLEAAGANIYLLGGVGMGAATKVAQNTITAMHLMAAAEGFKLAEKLGVDLEMFQEVVRTSGAQSSVADDYLHQHRTRPNWAYYHVLSDALDLGYTYDVNLPGAATCMQALARHQGR